MSSPLGTSDKLFLAAESLFAAHGYYGVTLREITTKAGVNLASVNYHYSDKESLYRDVVSQRLRQVNGTRLAALAKAESESGPGPVPVAELLRIFATPLFDPGSVHPPYGPASRRLLGRVLTEPLPLTAGLVAGEFQPGMTRFGQQLRRHFPSLPADDFIWKLSFVVGALHHALATLHTMRDLTSGICRDHDITAALRHYVTFAQNGLQSGSR